MEFQVFLQNQDHLTDQALHRGTRSIVALVIAAGMARKVGQNAIKLTTPLDWAWKEVKTRARQPNTFIRPFSKTYEHHIEPRIMSLRDSDFNRYLRGY